ncbi:cation:proton antiporter [Lichenifustis flavocetrariae]|uniref:Sodium:proton antiporter n=1 Tax=Lichenifustis flavocetrariae TaxID=2949735 RepID=A0AA41Z321_9HYPH|nr:sodium:proton antiporter [Lichenifustis flavocetrariae]MCW6508382.1 sodium:proton antiporter [Lichenifustis flavocetrariae]
MALFELVIVLLLGAAVLTTFSQRIGLPFPVLLAVCGAALALLPGETISARLDPDLALVLFVAPALLDTAYDTSLRDLKTNWRPIGSLVIAAVGVTVVAVALVSHALVPDLPWAAAIALGAIVAPPDAVAASAVLRQLSPPYRILVILEGESLLNDATALLIYRVALYALTGHFSAWTTLPLFVLGSLGGLVLGYALARLFPLLTRRLAEGPVSIVMQFVGTFAVWVLADALGLSPILTVVAYAITLARNASAHGGAETRVSSFAVWDVAVYVLNALAFILMGLQLKEIGRTADGRLGSYLGFSLAILLTVILVRLGWTMIYAAGVRYRLRRAGGDRSHMPSFGGTVVLGWCGMRGIVTLATALALPEGSASGLAHRDLMISAAFAVVLGTLVIQGLTLGPLIRWLRLTDDGMVAREEVFARQESARAALDTLRHDSRPEAMILRKEYNFRLREDTPPEDTLKPHVFGRLRLKAIRAEREALHKLRRSQKIGDVAFQTVQEELDWAEGHAVHRRRAFTAEAPPGDPGDIPGRPTS